MNVLLKDLSGYSTSCYSSYRLSPNLVIEYTCMGSTVPKLVADIVML